MHLGRLTLPHRVSIIRYLHGSGGRPGGVIRSLRGLVLSCAMVAAALTTSLAPVHAAAGVAAARWLNPSPQGNSIEALAFESDLVGFAVGVRGTTLRTTDGGGSWTDLSHPLDFDADLLDLATLGAGHLLAVGSGAGIFASDDSGESWRVVANPSIDTLRHLERIGGTTFSAVGDGGQRLLSTDAGDSWSLGSDTGLLFAHGQRWLDPSRGWVVGSPGVVETFDGGVSWTPVELDGFEFFDVQFADGQNGWIAEAFSMYRTTDGGASWTSMPQTPLYLNTQILYSTMHRLLICAGEGAEIYETRDDGLNWTPLYQRFGTVSYTAVTKLPNGRVVVASSDGDLLYSDDEGATWTNTTDGPGDEDRIELWKVNRRPDGRGYATGSSGDWLRTSDDGSTWTRESSPLGTFAYEVEFREDGLGFGPGVGSGTTLARTTDGGVTWTPHVVSPSFVGAPAGYEFASEAVIWAAFKGTNTTERVFRSTDAGITWESRGSLLSNADPIQAISFVDEDRGYIGGGWLDPQGKLLRTTNGGVDWAAIAIPSSVFGIWDMYWPTFEHGFLAARDTVYETTDGGITWGGILETDASQMSWRDAQHGAVFFYLSPTFQLTVDGGATWTDVGIPWSIGILDIEWVSDTRLWIAGPGSRLLEVDLLEPASVPGPDEVLTDTDLESPVRLLGNPARETLTLELETTAHGAAQFEWFDSAGRKLGSWSSAVGEGRSSVHVAVPANSRSAVLFLRVSLPDGGHSSHRVVVLE
ncbi:MAG: hypothetical protein H6682_10535 [Candidatus Eisenbacteria bacterium]|nr:hypothetical protein [Candidatus Eisenbacteria bacterium]